MVEVGHFLCGEIRVRYVGKAVEIVVAKYLMLLFRGKDTGA